MYRGYIPSSRSRISRRYNPDDDDDYVTADEEDTEQDAPYKRRYKSEYMRSRSALPAYSQSEADDEDDYHDALSTRQGRYSAPRRSSNSGTYIKLSHYDGPYDGSYEADMAPMLDYVPFGPSRHGILELTSQDDDAPSVYPALTSSTLTDRSTPIPERKPSVSLIPSYSKNNDDSITKYNAGNPYLNSLVSSAAAKAKSVLADSKVPEYKNASLVLSVEGKALGADGKKVDFRYYPPPIPLTGSSTIGIDERWLGITPSSSTPADSFLGGYLDRLRGMRTDVRDHQASGRRGSRASSVMSTSSYAPSYSHRTIHMPINISGREKSVPVSSYRSRLDDGQSHTVDVYPLVETSVSVGQAKAALPVVSASGAAPDKLTLLDRISIKVITNGCWKKNLKHLIYGTLEHNLP